MDGIMKVLDQTVREIKREVNLRVLKVPEIEQKVLDATSDEPWGPHGSDLADIARATKRFGECEIIMNVLWQRLGNTGSNWRHVYKALAVIEYLLANGTERAVDDIVDNSSQIAKYTSFEHVEPNGKDVGLNVRKKAEAVLAIVDDRDKLQQVREKAAATRDKYFGLSSTGITYKSSAASFGSGTYSSGSLYGSTGGSRENDTFKESYTGSEWVEGNKETKSSYSSERQRSKDITNNTTSYKSTKGEEHSRRNQDPSTSHSKLLSNSSSTSRVSSSQKRGNEDDNDDFNPRGTSTSGNASSNHVDLFGPSLMDDLVNTTASTSKAIQNAGTAALPNVDLFAGADFQSANSPLEGNIDLFAARSPFAGSFTSEENVSSAHPSGSAFDPFQLSFVTFPSGTKFSAHDTPIKSSQGKPSTPKHFSDAVFVLSTAIPPQSFDGSHSFGAFSSNTGSAVTEQTHDSYGGIKSSDHSPLEELNFGAFTSHTELPTESATESMYKSPTKLEQVSMAASRPAMKKETCHVKSGIWADSLSRGLIDLNIASPKKSSLPDVGAVRQLSEDLRRKDKPLNGTWGRQ